jgi:hypothetical protein
MFRERLRASVVDALEQPPMKMIEAPDVVN